MNLFRFSNLRWKRIFSFPGWWPLPGRETLRNGGYFEKFGFGNVFRSRAEAITAFFEKLDGECCRHCENRIFSESMVVEYAGLPHEPVG
jgi:hypothetical protein